MKVLKHAEIGTEKLKIVLMVQYAEFLEEENPYINKERLLNEIKLWREANNITKKLTDEEMRELKRIMIKN